MIYSVTDQDTGVAVLLTLATEPDHHPEPSLPRSSRQILRFISLLEIARSAILSRLIVQSALHLALLSTVIPSLLTPLSHSSYHQLGQIYHVVL